MHLVPCRYSLFGAHRRRLLPFGPLLRLQHALRPETKGIIEFPVVYDDCWPQALERNFRAAGFSHVETWITWKQTDYFEAVFPLYLLALTYEWLVRRLSVLGSSPHTQ